MDTIVIKLNQPEKAKVLMEILLSMDFIASVTPLDKYVNARGLFEEINKIAASSPLAEMNLGEINAEIEAYRHGT